MWKNVLFCARLGLLADPCKITVQCDVNDQMGCLELFFLASSLVLGDHCNSSAVCVSNS